MAITIANQNLEVSAVASVVVTTTVQDPNVGDYVRDIRIMDADGNIAVQLRIRSSTSDALKMTAPVQLY
jgi:hypothetical protein